MERGHGEKVHRNHLPEVVAQKSGPGLARGTTWLADHVLTHSALGDTNAQFEQLTMEARSAPERVGLGHLPNEGDRVWSEAFASRLARPAFPFPEQTKALPMPADHRFRSNQPQRLTPPAPSQGKPDPHHTIERVPARSLGPAAQDQELVPQGHILEQQMASRLQQGDSKAKPQTQSA